MPYWYENPYVWLADLMAATEIKVKHNKEKANDTTEDDTMAIAKTQCCL